MPPLSVEAPVQSPKCRQSSLKIRLGHAGWTTRGGRRPESGICLAQTTCASTAQPGQHLVILDACKTKNYKLVPAWWAALQTSRNILTPLQDQDIAVISAFASASLELKSHLIGAICVRMMFEVQSWAIR